KQRAKQLLNLLCVHGSMHGIVSRPYKIKGAYANLDRLTHCGANRRHGASITAVAWNIAGHMLSAIITYQILQQENPQLIDKVKAVLENHPWYANQRQARLQNVPVADHGLVLFMQAARWADDIRNNDKQQHRAIALHQLALQARWASSERADQ